MSDKSATFSIATLFWLTAAVAVHFSVCNVERIEPWWHPIPIVYNLILAASFVAACYVAKRYQNADLAWSLIAIGWLVAGVLLAEAHTHMGMLIGMPSVATARQEILRRFVVYMAVPLTISAPAIYLAMRAPATRSRARKWIIATAIIAVLNCVLLTAACYWMAAYLFAPEHYYH